MFLYLRVDGRFKVMFLLIDCILSLRIFLLYIVVFFEYVVRVNLVGILEIFRIFNSLGEVSV